MSLKADPADYLASTQQTKDSGELEPHVLEYQRLILDCGQLQALSLARMEVSLMLLSKTSLRGWIFLTS